jgi:nucleoid DNA-binding protein
MKRLSKIKLVHDVAKEGGMHKAEVSFIYDLLFSAIEKKLRAGHNIALPGIGTIYLAESKSQRSNMTGVTIPPHKRLKFHPNFSLARFIRVDTREYKI